MSSGCPSQSRRLGRCGQLSATASGSAITSASCEHGTAISSPCSTGGRSRPTSISRASSAESCAPLTISLSVSRTPGEAARTALTSEGNFP